VKDFWNLLAHEIVVILKSHSKYLDLICYQNLCFYYFTTFLDFEFHHCKNWLGNCVLINLGSKS